MTVRSARERRRVLLVGWDGADWQSIRPLLAAGKMPTLHRLIEGGVHGDLRTLEPVLSPMLWSSIATGKRADEHGILGFVEPRPDGKGIRPVTSTSRRARALWNMAQLEGLRSVVIGWFAGHPAEPIDGVIVTERFQRAPSPFGHLWPLPPGTVHPASRGAELAALRVHPGELTTAHFEPFLPRAGELGLDGERDGRLMSLARILADCSSVQAVATRLIADEPWDLFCVYFDAIDHFGHGFMRYHPPQRPDVSDRDFALYGGVIEAAHRYHDMMLERLLALAGDNVTVVLCSDHGFQSGELRPREGEQRSRVPNAGWHRKHGILVLHGPGIRAGDEVRGATLLDLAPTVLTALGLPRGADMPGRVLTEAFDPAPAVRTIPTWEDVDGEAGTHPPDAAEDPWESAEAVRQLVELGYVEALPDAADQAVTRVSRDRRYNLALVHLDADRAALAEPLLRELLAEDPKDLFVSEALGRALRRLGRAAEARTLVDEALAQAGAAKLTGAQTTRLEGRRHLAAGRLEEGLAALEAALEADPQLYHLRTEIGEARIALGQFAEAEAAFREEVALDPDHAAGRAGLALALLHQHRSKEAAEEALTAVELDRDRPESHVRLGLALCGLERLEAARAAFARALELDGKHPGAQAMLNELSAGAES